MSIIDIYHVLKEANKPLTIAELREITGLSHGSVWKNIANLKKRKEIIKIQFFGERGVRYKLNDI